MDDDAIIYAEAQESPVYVCRQASNNMIIRCPDVHAQGILSLDGSEIYQLNGKPSLHDDNICTAYIITMTEYEDIINSISPKEEDGDIIHIDDDIPDDDAGMLALIKERKIKEMNDTCQGVIFNGIDVQLSDGESHHFSLTEYDQLNLFKLETIARSGLVEVLPYHEDDKLCKYYPVVDIIAIADAATNYITYHTTYFNSIKPFIKSLSSIKAVTRVKYGTDIPEEFQSDVWKELNKANENQE